ncbi:hypothetical protein F2Q69_00016601 [Brassica cretica]|uniref:DNA-directed RNA polymerase n=1 Tax=Brassica cretica TaxID=69181 RepID=A0A8S9QR91_BRACR|nr:hypothetical protein F2Q69_00016601 [Brassica cretica]
MALSPAAASPSLSLHQTPHFHHQTSLITWLKPPPPPPSSALFRRKTLPISAASSSSSTSLSITDKPTSHFHGNLIDTFESHDPTTKGATLIEESDERNELSARRRLFTQDPPWISALFLKGLTRTVDQTLKLEKKDIDKRKFDSLRRRQVKEETEAWERMVDEYRELEKEMCEKSLAPNLPYVKHMFLGWFQPLRDVIEREQRLQKNKSKKVRAAYAPHIELLPADKMAVIVMHKMMGLVMSGHEDGCIQVVQAAVSIGIAIEHEVRIHNFLKRTRKNNAGDSQEELKDKQLLRKRVNSLIRRKRIIDALKVVKSDGIKPWGRATQAKLGSRLLELLMETAYVQPPLTQSGDSIPEVRPAFRHKFKTVTKYPGSKLVRRYGVIECDSLLLAGLDKSAKHMLIPYVPMLVPPKRWKGYDKGGYLFLPSYIMRTHGSKKQQDALKDISSKTAHRVFEALDTLGNTKWRVNRKILDVVERLWADGGNIAGLVNREDKDSSKDPESNPTAALAKILINQVDRKLVKQTVMTSVYGVTYVGAREQIKRRLEEKGVITDERMLFAAACYSAKVTLAALGEIFEAARAIMSWLGDCAKIIALDNHPVRWTTPLGLPVVQPYCRSERHLVSVIHSESPQIRTSLQVLALQREGNTVDVRKQRTAFPPNFVHSLDGTHMMMTAVACREAGLNFAGVHDSYWTHACDVDTMNRILREKFVELYSSPILEDLLQSFQESYPTLVFPPVPKRGDFDLEEVLKSQYFFN